MVVVVVVCMMYFYLIKSIYCIIVCVYVVCEMSVHVCDVRK